LSVVDGERGLQLHVAAEVRDPRVDAVEGDATRLPSPDLLRCQEHFPASSSPAVVGVHRTAEDPGRRSPLATLPVEMAASSPSAGHHLQHKAVVVEEAFSQTVAVAAPHTTCHSSVPDGPFEMGMQLLVVFQSSN
jgi:hypothetical protein